MVSSYHAEITTDHVETADLLAETEDLTTYDPI